MGKQQKGVNGLLFYDFEVFKYDWLVVVMDMTAKKTHVIINSPEELEALYKANIKEIWVGFNSRHYDQYILKAILCGFDPKKVNDYIITKGNPGWKFSSLFRQFPLWNYDVMLNTDVGLKSFEGFMGNDIKETSVPFNIDRKLTPEEIAETVKYCKHDVEQTVQVFLKRTEEFNTMMYFIKHFGLSMDYISKTKAQLAAEILGGNRKGADFDDEFQFPILDCLHLNKYKHMRNGTQILKTTITARNRINRLWQGLNIPLHGAAVTGQGQNIPLMGYSLSLMLPPITLHYRRNITLGIV